LYGVKNGVLKYYVFLTARHTALFLSRHHPQDFLPACYGQPRQVLTGICECWVALL